MRRFGQIIRQTSHFGKSPVRLDADRPLGMRTKTLEDQIPAADELARIKKGMSQ
jgi:hypothetical protein